MSDMATLNEAAQLIAHVQPRRRQFKSHSEYRSSGVPWIGEIPNLWDVPPLYARYKVELGKMLDEKRLTRTMLVPYLRNIDVQWDRINIDAIPQMDISEEEYARFTVRPGDLLVCEGGEVGRCAFWNGQLPVCGFQKALHRLRPLNPTIDFPRFLFYVMSNAASRGVFIAGGNPNTIPHLTAEKLRVYRFAFPSFDEQRAIAAFLERETAKIDSLVAKKRRLIELLGENRTALISRAVTKGLNPDAPMKPSGIDWLGDVPDHWKYNKLGFLVSMRGGMTPSKDNDSYWNGSVPWVSPKDMKSREITDTEDHISESALSETTLTLFSPPVVLMVVRGMILAHTFPVAITKVPVTVNQDMKALTPNGDCSEEYLLNLLNGLGRVILGTVDDSAHGTKVLRLPVWKHVEVFLPEKTEQAEINDFINETLRRFDGLIGKVESAISRLNEYRSSLISAAVTGQIDVREEVAP